MNGTFLGLLADVSIRASVAALLVGGSLAAVRVRSSALRHASWTAVLLAMLLMPALIPVVPVIAIPFPLSAPAVTSSPGVDHVEAAPELTQAVSADSSFAAVARPSPRSPERLALQSMGSRRPSRWKSASASGSAAGQRSTRTAWLRVALGV